MINEGVCEARAVYVYVYVYVYVQLISTVQHQSVFMSKLICGGEIVNK